MKNTNHFYIREFDTIDLAQKYETPLFVVDLKAIRENVRAYETSIQKNYTNYMLCYAYKANPLLRVCSTLKNMGCGAEIVSEGEFYVSDKVGLHPKKVVFNGVNKSKKEILKCAESGVYMLVADSIEEIDFTESVLTERNFSVHYGIRVNPEVNTGTHTFIATGEKNAKFGVPYSFALTAFEKASQMDHIKLRGIHFHIGSQIKSLKPFSEAIDKIIDLYIKLEHQGINLDTIDVGGGLAVSNNTLNAPSIDEYVNLITSKIKEHSLGVKIIFEPGRRLLDNSGYVLLTVGSIKDTFAMVDAGANLFLRAVYLNWYYDVVVANKMNYKCDVNYDIAGPLCFSGDIIAKNRSLPTLVRGDTLCVKNTAAYTLSMADTYNYRLRPKVIAIDDTIEVIKEEDTFEDLTRHEVNWNV